MKRMKYRSKGLVAILLLLVLVTVSLPVSALAAELPTATATITVEKKLTGDTPPITEDFVFTLTPDDETYPMPQGTGGDTLTISGAGTASFGAITYSKPDTYTYTVRETTGSAANFTYDKTVYQVTVYVTSDDLGTLTTAIRVTKEGTEEKSANAVFTNSYRRPPDPGVPQTGDTADPILWIALAGASVGVLLLLLIRGKRKEAERQKQ